MAFDAKSAVEAFRRRFQAKGSKRRAEGEKAYLKSNLRFHGVSLPFIRSEAKVFCRSWPASRTNLRALAREAYATPFHDIRSAAIAVLEQDVGLLETPDLPWLVSVIRQSANWAHVDWLATKVIGPVVCRSPGRARNIRRWAKDGDFWVRRTALLAQLDEFRAGRGDFGLFSEIAIPMLSEREFFIRKALGWILREVTRKRPSLVVEFVNHHASAMSGLTFREATKHLPSADRLRLVRAREAEIKA